MENNFPSNLLHQELDSNLHTPFLPVVSRYIQVPTGTMRISALNGFVNEISFLEKTPVEPTGVETSSPEIDQCATELHEYFAGTRMHFSFPYLQTGTTFQQRVWKELAEIPFGKTINYNQLALRLGDQKVIRAAASANGRNKLAIVIPCHRVIGTNGDLVGYAGGLPNKRWLLQHEAKHFHGVQTLF